MAHEPDIHMAIQDPGPTNAYHHCKLGQETVHDIVAKATELFNHLKSSNAGLQRTADNEAKRAKIKDILTSIQSKFNTLREHYNSVSETCSTLAYIQIKSLIPFKDDPDNIEIIQKHRRNLSTEPHLDNIKEKEELTKKIAERNDQLKTITNELRDFIYEVNTMLIMSKSSQ